MADDPASVPATPRPVSRVRGRSARTQIALGVGAFALGVLVLYVGLVTMGSVGGLVKVPVVVAGCLGLLAGVSWIGKGVWGQSWDTGFWLSLSWLVALGAAAVLADVLPLAEHQDTAATLSEPGNLRPDLLSEHPFGTNNFSLDLLGRSIHGARVSLLTVGVAVGISMVIGGTIGMFAGYYRGWVDNVVSVLTDSVLAIPALVLLVALAAVLGQPTEVVEAVLKTGIALAIVGIPTMVRLARANTLAFAQREFVLASRAMGSRHRRIVFREILPNVALPVVSYAFIIMAVLIVAEGSLAYLGLGLQQPKPTWGNMIAEGDFTVLRRWPHIPLVPGAFMFLTVFALNRVGERARGAWDTRVAQI